MLVIELNITNNLQLKIPRALFITIFTSEQTKTPATACVICTVSPIIKIKIFIFQELVAHTKAQLLSRRVWDILQAVPLNPTLLEAFQNPIESKLPELLDPTSPQKLMYSLHIIDKLSSNNNGPNVKDSSGIIEKTEEEKVAVENWNDLFIKKGGLRILYDIMMSGKVPFLYKKKNNVTFFIR